MAGTKTKLSGAAVLLAAASVGCTPASNAAAGAKSLVHEMGDRATDMSISMAVNAALIDDPIVKSKQIEVRTVNGVVTMTGSQPTLVAKQHAIEAARKAKGVKSVVDEIVVEGMPMPQGGAVPVQPGTQPGGQQQPVAPPPGVWQ